MDLVRFLFIAAVVGVSAQGDFRYRMFKIVAWVAENGSSSFGPKCLQVMGKAEMGAAVVWGQCDEGVDFNSSNQMWHMDGIATFKNTPLCLDVGNSSHANFSEGAPLQLWKCLSAPLYPEKAVPRQRWYYASCDYGESNDFSPWDGPSCDHPAISDGSWGSVYAKSPNATYWKLGGVPPTGPGPVDGMPARISPGQLWNGNLNVAAIEVLVCIRTPMPTNPPTIYCDGPDMATDGVSITVERGQKPFFRSARKVALV